MSITIAIDGPSGSGKSTAARLVARRLQIKYVDTGAMYRVVTLAALKKNYDFSRPENIVRLSKNLSIEFGELNKDSGQKVYMDGEEVTGEIRKRDVDERVSDVAVISGVREDMLEKQRQLAAEESVVMDGRDIGTRVLPDADVKIYLTASLEERTRRRYRELREKNIDISREEVKKNLLMRDKKDSSRSHSPLRKADTAVEIDSDNMTPKEVADRIIELAEKGEE